MIGVWDMSSLSLFCCWAEVLSSEILSLESVCHSKNVFEQNSYKQGELRGGGTMV